MFEVSDRPNSSLRPDLGGVIGQLDVSLTRADVPEEPKVPSYPEVPLVPPEGRGLGADAQTEEVLVSVPAPADLQAPVNPPEHAPPAAITNTEEAGRQVTESFSPKETTEVKPEGVPSEGVAPTNETIDVRAQVSPILELDDASFQEQGQAFIERRLEKLQTGEDQSRLHAFTGSFQGFIQQETPVAPLSMGRPYKLDDPTVYDSVLAGVRDLYGDLLAKHGDPEKAYRNAVLVAAQYAQQDYFGNVHNPPDSAEVREALLYDDVGELGVTENRSIAEFKGVAKCAERATVVNNILQVCGLQPVLEFGTVATKDEAVPHAYLFIQGEAGREFVFDPTNPVMVFDDQDRLIQTNPALYPAGEALAHPDDETAITGIRKEYQLGPQGPHVREQTQYNYFLSPFHKELRPQ